MQHKKNTENAKFSYILYRKMLTIWDQQLMIEHSGRDYQPTSERQPRRLNQSTRK